MCVRCASKTILLVDDNTAMRRVMRRVLGAAYPQLVIIEAASAKEALECLDDTICCVISDLSMPVMDGIELCKIIRQAAEYRRWRSLPIVLVSAFISDELVERAWRAGTSFVLAKPFTVEDVAEIIRHSTGLKAGQPAEPVQESALVPAQSRRNEDIIDVEFFPECASLTADLMRTARPVRTHEELQALRDYIWG